MAKFISSKHLEGVSDLTLSAPIKKGFIHAFESVTYETRLKLLLKSLFKIRQTAREYSEIKPFVDTSEQIQSLLDFRLAVLEDTEPRRLLLTATFDRPFEPYMRLIWRPLGTLLDVIFCNCEGYVTATENSFEDYLDWVRRSQIDTDFFWAMAGNSVDDYQYVLKIDRLERLRARGPLPAPVGPIETRDRAEADGPSSALKVDPALVQASEVRDFKRKEADFLGFEALASLYRLTDFYPPDDPEGDGELLRKAAQMLLDGWDNSLLPEAYENPLLIREQLGWLRNELPRRPRHATGPDGRPRAKRRTPLAFDLKAVQGGIVDGYGNKTEPTRQGALLLMRIIDPARARRFIGGFEVQSGDTAAPAPADGIYRNLAFTRQGLLNIGVPETEYARFPQEFREGMEDRAGLLGDLRMQHPRRWTLPARNWPPVEQGEPRPTGVVELSEIDLVVQLRTTVDHKSDDPVGDSTHPLHDVLNAIANWEDSGVELLAVEPMQRASKDIDEFARDHFGYRDGFSQPKAKPEDPPGRDKVEPGEIFRGHLTDRDELPAPESWLLDNGTFLVVRKLRQHVARFHSFVKAAAEANRIDEDMMFGLIVGRTRDGHVLRPGTASESNDFDYRADVQGAACPFQAHIRRTNPRQDPKENFERTTPRILRRGMSYGPRYVEDEKQPAHRGIMFMAYCGSLAEQYEVIQRWVSGGNSTAIGSWLSDPMMGAPAGETRTFRFAKPAGAAMEADPGGDPPISIEIREPFVELQWGAYLFVPSIAAIAAIAALPDLSEGARRDAETAEAERGDKIVRKLVAMARGGAEGRAAAAAAWKASLEDFGSKDPAEKANGPAIWAAIRRYHGGALRVPYPDSTRGGEVRTAVLAAAKDLVMQVFQNPDGHYSMCGQMGRMRRSFGEIFLGMDGGPDYEEKSKINPIIYEIGEERAFTVAREASLKWMDQALKGIATSGANLPKIEVDLRRHFITPVLGFVCHHWFGIPDELPPKEAQFVTLRGWDWKPVLKRKPSCPGDYMATSRYCFYPDPVAAVQDYGKAQGQALRAAVRARFQKLRGDGWPPEAHLALRMSEIYADDDEMARVLIGVMTGFLPPTDGSLRWTLYEWLEEKTIWRIQRDLRSASGSDYERAKAAIEEPLKRAMQKRPSPDMLWRTATEDHSLGGVEVRAGERVLIGIVSAMAEDTVEGRTDVYPVFGGRRRQAGAADPGPLHACPAYKFAIGTMLGMLCALLDSLEIKALPAPLLVEIKPLMQPAAAPPPPAAAPSA